MSQFMNAVPFCERQGCSVIDNKINFRTILSYEFILKNTEKRGPLSVGGKRKK